MDPLEFLARLLTHIPDPGQVMTRYDGWYPSRTRGMRQRQAAGGAGAGGRVEAPVAISGPADWSLRAARYRWAELLRRVFEVEPLAWPRCAALVRIVAVITDPAVISRILTHRARVQGRARRARSPPPSRRRPATRGAGGQPWEPVPVPPRSLLWIPGPSARPPVTARRRPSASAPSRDPCRARTAPTHPDPDPAHRPARS